MSKNNPTIKDVIISVGEVKTSVDEILEAILAYAEKNDQNMVRLDNRVGNLETKVTTMNSQMVTKSYLDQKLGKVKGELGVLIRKGNKKQDELISVLKNKQILTTNESSSLIKMGPFPVAPNI